MQDHATFDEIDVFARTASTLEITFTNNLETVGVGLVPTSAAKAVVPAPFRLPDDTQPVTPLVVLANKAGGIAVAGGAPEPGVYVQIGLLIAPPDGSGDINTLLLWHYTTHRHLARGMRRFGFGSQYVLALDYAIERDGEGGTTSLDVPRPAQPQLAMDGTFIAPSLPLPNGFVANWWSTHSGNLLKSTTTVPQGMIGEAQLRLTADAGSALGRLIGGGSLDFAALQNFNMFAYARTELSVLRESEEPQHL